MGELSHKSDQRGKTDISDLIMLNVNQQWETEVDGLWGLSGDQRLKYHTIISIIVCTCKNMYRAHIQQLVIE